MTGHFEKGLIEVVKNVIFLRFHQSWSAKKQGKMALFDQP